MAVNGLSNRTSIVKDSVEESSYPGTVNLKATSFQLGIQTFSVDIRTQTRRYLRSLVGSVDLHLSVETVVQQKVVRHSHPVRLHGMTLDKNSKVNK